MALRIDLFIGSSTTRSVNGRNITYYGGNFFGIEPLPCTVGVPPGEHVSAGDDCEIYCQPSEAKRKVVVLTIRPGDHCVLPGEVGPVTFIGGTARGPDSAGNGVTFIPEGVQHDHSYRDYVYSIYCLQEASGGGGGGGGGGERSWAEKHHVLMDRHDDRLERAPGSGIGDGGQEDV